MSNKKKLRIAFSWQTLTSENLGVGALAQSQIALVREAATSLGIEIEAVEFCPIGPNLELAKSMKCELADPLSIKNIVLGKSRYLKQLKECDAVFDIGAGDSFSDIYGFKHFFFLSLSKYFALMLGKPLVMSPQTIGPFSRNIVKRMAKYLMHRSAKVFARDDMSMAILREMGITENAQEVIDVAFSLPFEKQSYQDDIVRVGINVSGLLMNGGYTGNNQFGLKVDYPAVITGILDKFTAMPGVEVHLVGHVLADTMPVEDDYLANIALQKQYPMVKIAPKFKSPSEAKSYISGLNFFTGARMHACIGAFSSGVPVVPMAYSRKFNGLFGSLGYYAVADLKADDTTIAIEKILTGFDERSQLKEKVDAGNIIAQQKLQGYRVFIQQFLAQLVK